MLLREPEFAYKVWDRSLSCFLKLGIDLVNNWLLSVAGKKLLLLLVCWGYELLSVCLVKDLLSYIGAGEVASSTMIFYLSSEP